MTDHLQSTITVKVNATNPGQFFACCGLLELADRLWRGAEGWFADDDEAFLISAGGTLDALVQAIATAELIHACPSDPLLLAIDHRYSLPSVFNRLVENGPHRRQRLESVGRHNGKFRHCASDAARFEG